MLTPTVLSATTPFYAVGNTPAVSFTRCIPQGVHADILLLGCGDVRNILYTAYSEKGFPARKLDITACDVEEAIIARNVLLLTLMVAHGQTTPSRTIWATYYNLFLDDEAIQVLDNHIHELLAFSNSLDEWRSCKFGSKFHFSDGMTLQSVREIWAKYAGALTDKDSERYRSDFENALKSSTEYRNATAGDGSLAYWGARAAAPLGMQVMMGDELKTILDTWWEKGTTDSATKKMQNPNPLFAVSLSKNSVLHHGSNPILSFHLAAAMAHLSEASPMKLPEVNVSSSIPSLSATAALQFSDWTKAFIELAHGDLIIRFTTADAFALCHTLQHHIATGQTSANFYRRNLSPECLTLDLVEYSNAGAPKKFDVIDTSNLSDHFGALNILVSATPLLKDVTWATLHTETMCNTTDEKNSNFDEILCGRTKTVSTLLGISAVEYWTNATTTSNVDEYLLDVTVAKTAPLIRWRFVWKRNSHLCGQEKDTQLKVKEDELATLIYQIYQSMFASENPMALLSLSQDQQVESIRKQTYPKYHRGSLVAFMKHLLQVVDTNVKMVCKKVMEKIAKDSTLIFGSNFLQSMSLEMSRQGLFSEDWLKEAIRKGPDAGFFEIWPTIPEGVYLTLVVPKSSWNSVYSAALASRIGFSVEGSMTCSKWHNLFADVQVVFGVLEPSGERGSPDFSVAIKEDKLGWAGESSMIATFYVPTIAVQLKPKNTKVALCVQNTFQNIKALKAKAKLGEELQISDADLEDEDRVYITKNPPGQAGAPIFGSLCPSQPAKAMDSECSSYFSANLDASGRIDSLTGHLDILSTEGKKLLADKASVDVRQLSPFIFNISLGAKDMVENLYFPIPIDKDRSKTRIARASAYIEVIAPIANPATAQSLDNFIFPTTLAECRSTCSPGLLIPATLNIPHLNLDTLPIIDVSDKEHLGFLTLLASWTFSIHERKLREQTVGSNQGGLAPSARLNFKESLFTMFMLASGLQGGQTGLFAINHPKKGGIHILIFVSAIRLDGANGSIALDAAVIPLTLDVITSGQLESFLLILRTLECCTITVDDEELLLWKKALPALVERCRSWSHTTECEYAQPGATVPLSTTEGAQVICSCGTGKFPENFISLPEWDTAAKFATRLAISPTFAVPFVEQVVDLEVLKGMASSGLAVSAQRCRSCGASQGNNGTALKKCMRCLKVQYCSVQCQKKDWKKHRMECEEASPAWEGGK
ncbi:hypothetical protein N0V82_007169 [Gnomoniopsis sp. IMI 355080]|nr:hypothetical protein N0V82_007169 [Gnomoniopsis sp. IMI 355080]